MVSSYDRICIKIRPLIVRSPVDIEAYSADQFDIAETMPGLATVDREGIGIIGETGLGGGFEEPLMGEIIFCPAFHTGHIAGEVEFIVQPFPEQGDIRFRDHETGAYFQHGHEITGTPVCFVEWPELNIVDMVKVGTIGMFEMKKVGGSYGGIGIEVFIAHISFHMESLVIAYDVFGMVEIEFDGLGLGLVEIEPDSVVVLRNADLERFL